MHLETTQYLKTKKKGFEIIKFIKAQSFKQFVGYPIIKPS